MTRWVRGAFSSVVVEVRWEAEEADGIALLIEGCWRLVREWAMKG